MLSTAENLLGQQLAGYRLLELLGRGGMSLVFVAERVEQPQQQVAIKVLLSSPLATPEDVRSFRTRFLREAQTVQHLHHQHILPVLGYGDVEELPYMIMPLMTGGTLAKLLALRLDPVPLTEIAGYLHQLASAIDYAHQQGVLHRDIKPSNVLLDEQAGVYLADFGIAQLFKRSLDASDEALSTLTTTGMLCGTPAYMAPERFQGQQAQPASDIYALGILLYQLVTGHVPFTADNPLVVGMKQLHELPRSPGSVRPDLPEPAEAAMLRALAKQPAARFATATALAVAFEAGIQEQGTAGVLALPPLPVGSAELVDIQEHQPAQAPLVPLAEGPFPSKQRVSGPAFASVTAEVPGAPARSGAPSSPLVPSRSRQGRAGRRWLLAGVILLALVFLGLLPLLAFPQWSPSPDAAMHVLLPSPSRVPTRTGEIPASSGGVMPTRAPESTPPPGVTPPSNPHTTSSLPHSPTPTPTLMPTPTPTPQPAATPSPSPTLPPTPTATPTSTPTPTATPSPSPTPSPTLAPTPTPQPTPSSAPGPTSTP
jgi:serine/threonine protein kinase